MLRHDSALTFPHKVLFKCLRFKNIKALLNQNFKCLSFKINLKHYIKVLNIHSYFPTVTLFLTTPPMISTKANV